MALLVDMVILVEMTTWVKVVSVQREMNGNVQ